METQKALARGERLVASLNQPQFVPWPVEDQVMIIFAATQGYADDIPVADVPRFNASLLAQLKRDNPEIGLEIATSKDLSGETEAALRGAIEVFKESWSTDAGIE